MLDKARTLDVDQVVIDLEDSVPAELKNDARRQAVLALTRSEWKARSLALRVNGVKSDCFDEDIASLAETRGSRLRSIVVPKLETVEMVEQVDEALSRVEHHHDLAPLRVEGLIETALGLVNVDRLATGPRLTALIFGPADLAASLGIPQLRIGETDDRYPGDQWHYARTRIIVAAAAYGLYALDGPYASFADIEGFRRSATQARLLGFAGKWLIHPSQIEMCNNVFTPTVDEVVWAQRVQAELERLEGSRGASIDGGAMIDEASSRLAAQIIARSQATSKQAATK
jgi:citrate lyase subunit beta/citryl-CoA lyase